MPESNSGLAAQFYTHRAYVEDALKEKVSKREMDMMRREHDRLEDKVDRMLQNQTEARRVAVWQLAAIVVTLAVAILGLV